MKVIIVTGTPCTGKTTIAKKLSKKLNYKYIDVNDIIKKHKLSEGYDKKRKTKIIDIKKLDKVLVSIINQYQKTIENIFKNKKNQKKELSKSQKRNTHIEALSKALLAKKFNGIIIDSHLSHYLPKKYVDLCIVTKCDLKALNKRLKKRKYNKNKIRENLDSEIFDVCLNEAKEQGHNVFVINTTQTIKIGSLSNKLKNYWDVKWH